MSPDVLWAEPLLWVLGQHCILSAPNLTYIMHICILYMLCLSQALLLYVYENEDNVALWTFWFVVVVVVFWLSELHRITVLRLIGISQHCIYRYSRQWMASCERSVIVHFYESTIFIRYQFYVSQFWKCICEKGFPLIGFSQKYRKRCQLHARSQW